MCAHAGEVPSYLRCRAQVKISDARLKSNLIEVAFALKP
jgi:hypothetical protein